MRRVAAGAAAGDLLHVEVGEERVEPVSSRARSDAEQGGHHDRKEGAAELDATRQVLPVLLLGARGEERVGVGGGGGDVRRKHRARDGDVDGERVGRAVEGTDDDVDLGAAGGRRVEVGGGGGLGGDELLGEIGDQLGERVVAFVAEAGDAAGEVVVEVAGVHGEVVVGRHGAVRREVGALGVAVERRASWSAGRRETEAVAVEEGDLGVGESGGGGDVVDGEEGVGEGGGGVAEASAGGGGEGRGGQQHGGEEVGEDGAAEGVLRTVAGDGV